MCIQTKLHGIALVALCAFAGEASGQNAPPPSADVPATDERYTEDQTPKDDAEAERLAIWNSQEMLNAREWLVDHMARSAQITPSQSKRYMEELERLSAPQLKLWLMTFEEQQAERARQRESFERARQQSVENALRQNQARQQAGENIGRTREEATRNAQEAMAEQQRASQERSRQLASDRDAAARAMLQSQPYIWLNTLPWGPYAGYPVGGGAAIDPAAFQGVLGVTNREPQNTIAPGSGQGRPPER